MMQARVVRESPRRKSGKYFKVMFDPSDRSFMVTFFDQHNKAFRITYGFNDAEEAWEFGNDEVDSDGGV